MMVKNSSDSIHSIIEIDIARIRRFAGMIGQRYQQIKSIFLFGSVARGDTDEKSDIDLLFLIYENNSGFYDVLSHDDDYRIFEDWALEKVEGGVNPFVCDSEELIRDFDTLIEKILLEGIRLYGKDIEGLQNRLQQERKKSKSNLLDLVRSL